MTKMNELSAHYAIFSVTGARASTFLQGQLTCDVSAIKEQELYLGGFCNQKGRLRALFKIFKVVDSFYLIFPAALQTSLLPLLKKVALFSKVEISVFDFNQGLSLLEQITPVSSHTSGLKHTFLKGSFNDCVLADIRAGIPEVWLESYETFLPHHLNLPALAAVSFKKGCYLGQEIIARMEYRGKPKRTMVRGVFSALSTLLSPGTEISFTNTNDQQDFITVVSAAMNEDNQVEALLEIPIATLNERNQGTTLLTMQHSLLVIY